jgi:EAL domain-containing protein (putative c-di-GMP-specific phosphodiesterase class I)
LIKHADIAMYHAKDRGKNGFQFYKKELNIKAGERLSFENDVRKAVANKEFILHYQPQIDLSDGSIIGAEALARWEHESLGPVSPVDFIPAIEELGLVVPFTEWVIAEVAAQRTAWKKQGFDKLKLAFNISSKQFIQQQLPEKISESLNLHSLEGLLLELEMTESVLAQTGNETLAILQELKKLNLTISIDDFGTGYSSLAYLKAFPIDVIKVDRLFIKDMLKSERDASIVKAIIALAHGMGVKVVAEGVEEKDQYTLLREIGCNYAQGYLFSRPIPAQEFEQILRDEVNLLPR